MRFLTVAALAAGGAASAIPAASNPFLPAAKNSIHRRITQLVTLIPPQTCSSYTTVTVTPSVLTVTRTEDVTVTVETVTSTRVSVKQSTQETTDIATVTTFETSFVTATVTAATVTKTTVAQQPLRKKKRGDSCKRHLSSSSSAAAAQTTSSSSSSSASDDISVAPSTSSSSDAVTSTSPSIIPSGPVCTVTVSAAALNTTVTVTATGSATATAIETVTSLIVSTVTTTVHTTDLKTTAVPTTLAVTATTTTIAPAATPTFVLRAAGGDVDSKYLVMVPSFEPSFSYIDYTTASNAATKFHLDAGGALVPAGAPAGSFAHFSDADGIASYVLVTDKTFAEPMSGKPTQCRLQAGATAVGATGAFTCPDDGALKVFSNIDGHLNVQYGSEPGTVFTLKYTVVS